MRSIRLTALQDAFDKSLKNQAKFYCIYMKLLETILLFIQATREQSWELHLYSLQQLCLYFFAFNMTNYLRLTLVYLSQMLALRENDERTWNLMKEGVSALQSLMYCLRQLGQTME